VNIKNSSRNNFGQWWWKGNEWLKKNWHKDDHEQYSSECGLYRWFQGLLAAQNSILALYFDSKANQSQSFGVYISQSPSFAADVSQSPIFDSFSSALTV